MARRSQVFRLAQIAISIVALGCSGAATASAAAPRAAHAAVHHNRTRHHHKPSRHIPVRVAPKRAGVASGAPALAAGPCTGGDLIPTPENLATIRSATLCLINRQRAAHGVAPVRNNADLQTAAQRHSTEMVTQDYLDHVGPNGLAPIDRMVGAGYGLRAASLDVGENIAAEEGALAAPAATVADWMSSAEHRSVMLDPGFTDTGIGVVAAAPASLAYDGGATYTECFGAAR